MLARHPNCRVLNRTRESKASVENEELSQLFSAAMEATDRRAEEARVARDDSPDLAEAFEDEDFELDVEIESTSLDLSVDYLREQMLKATPELVSEETEEPEATVASSELESDTESQIEQLLSGSFGSLVSDEDPDLAFPDFDDEEVEDAMPAGALAALAGSSDSEALAMAEQRAVSLRRQVNQISRTLSERELELQTAQDRVTTLEAQVVQAARQTASTGREFQSFRVRAEREQEDARKFAAEKILKDLLGVLDNLERALEHAGDARKSALGTGVEMTLEQFVGILDRAGASRIEPSQGETFDPNFHEAVGQEEHDSIAVGCILRSLQKGLVLNGRLVRAAMVVVSTGDGSQPTEAVAAVAVEINDVEADAATTEAPKKKKKRRRKKRKKAPSDQAGEALEAASDVEGGTPRPKKKRKRKRKPKSGDTPSTEANQTSSE